MSVVKICHASDLHGKIPSDLPHADVYIFSGDIYPNFPIVYYSQSHNGKEDGWYIHNEKLINSEARSHPRNIEYLGRKVDPEIEVKLQLMWARKNTVTIKNDEAAIIVCRGNHDFIDLAHLFPHNSRVFEISTSVDDSFFTDSNTGLTFCGFRGIPYIAGEWADELRELELEAVTEGLDKLITQPDVLITHGPCQGILDGPGYGNPYLRKLFTRFVYDDRKLPKLHLHGHQHTDGGINKIDPSTGVIHVNAACHIMEYSIEV